MNLCYRRARYPCVCNRESQQYMIIQTAPANEPRLAVMMHEHTALAAQFARAFGNDRFAPVQPADLMFYVVSHHDEGWAEFDRNPATDDKTGLPYNLVETRPSTSRSPAGVRPNSTSVTMHIAA